MPNVSFACRAVPIGRATAYHERERNPKFAAQWDEALRDGADGIHAAAWERATRGVLRPIYQCGVLVGHERVFSDRLAEVLLKMHMPELFGRLSKDRQGGGPATVATPEQVLEQVRKFLPRLSS